MPYRRTLPYRRVPWSGVPLYIQCNLFIKKNNRNNRNYNVIKKIRKLNIKMIRIKKMMINIRIV